MTYPFDEPASGGTRARVMLTLGVSLGTDPGDRSPPLEPLNSAGIIVLHA